MKVISTFVATILLVVIVIGIGSFLALWISGFFRGTGSQVESSFEIQQKCASVTPSIEKVSNNSVVISNPNNVKLTNVIVYVENIKFGEVSELNPFEVKTLTNTSIGISNYKYVRVNALCLEQILVYSTCEKGWKCWEA